MPPKPLPPKRRRLGELLVAAGLLKDVELQAALAEQRKWGGRLGRTLVEMGFLREEAMLVTLAQQLGLSTVDLDRAQIPKDVVRGLRVDMAERYGVFPVRFDPEKRELALATSDPTDLEQAKQLSFYTGMKLSFVLSSSGGIDRAIRRHYYGERTDATSTATPQELGLSEAVFTPSELHRNQRPVEETAEECGAKEKIYKLEAQLAEQNRAFRALLEVLVERGAIRREDYLARLRKKSE